MQTTDSLLDYVLEASRSLNRKLGAADRALRQRLPGIGARGRAPRAEARWPRPTSLGNLPDAPLGAPDDFTELLDVQFEMMALAFQTNQTRVATLRMIKEASMRTYHRT